MSAGRVSREWLLLAGWAAAVVMGFAYAWSYSLRPGQASTARAWPRDTGLSRGDEPTLVMFVEPDCPCSMASLNELNLLLQDRRNKVRAHIVFEPSAEAAADVSQTALYKRAMQVGVAVHIDTDSRERQRFDAHTSGVTQLYDSEGDLLYQGGITPARGHEGDNVGRRILAGFLQKDPEVLARPRPMSAPVYGCHFDMQPNAARERSAEEN
ncbi:MAG TPA: hypothetical protein VFH51_16695 [Myxococcota bacterium]|nr:hypothetical protein [Myxococcota bacterium]